MKKYVFFVIAVSMSLSVFAIEKRKIDFSNHAKSYDISVSTDKEAIINLDRAIKQWRTNRYKYNTKSLTLEFEPIKSGERFKSEIMLRAQGGKYGEIVDMKKYEIEINKIQRGEKPTIKINYSNILGIGRFDLSADKSLGLTYKEISSNNNKQPELGS